MDDREARKIRETGILRDHTINGLTVDDMMKYSPKEITKDMFDPDINENVDLEHLHDYLDMLK